MFFPKRRMNSIFNRHSVISQKQYQGHDNGGTVKKRNRRKNGKYKIECGRESSLGFSRLFYAPPRKTGNDLLRRNNWRSSDATMCPIENLRKVAGSRVGEKKLSRARSRRFVKRTETYPIPRSVPSYRELSLSRVRN